MKSYLAAIGAGGARVAEAAIFASVAGLWPADSLRIVLIGVPPAEERRLRVLTQDYMTVRTPFGVAPHAGFGPALLLRRWPEGEGLGSLRSFCTTMADRQLLRALFASWEADTEGLDGALPVVTLNWERLLRDETPNGVLAEAAAALRDEPLDTRLVIAGSLCESCCAAGVPALLGWLAATAPEATPAKVLLLPMTEMEESANAAAALRALAGHEDRLCLLGLPEDCREKGREADLIDWLAVHAATLLMGGEHGPLTYRLPLGTPSWQMFGDQAERWQQAWTAMMRAAFLMGTEYTDTAVEQLESPNWLRDRMNPWFSPFFQRVSRDQKKQKDENAEVLRAADRVLREAVRWTRDAQASMPAAIRLSDALMTKYRQAAAHYERVLGTYGQLHLLLNDIRQSEINVADIVHRGEAVETEEEEAIRQAEELRSRLIAQLQEQEDKNREIGGRMTRLLLEEAVAHSRAQAEDVRAQLATARERIAAAQALGGVVDSSRIVAARTSVERLEHHLYALDRRTDCAEHDLAAFLTRPDALTAPVAASLAAAGESEPLFDRQVLASLISLPQMDRKAQKQALQSLDEMWPWPEMPLDEVKHEIATDDLLLQELMPAARFIHQVMRCCGAEGGEQHG